jgi:hypothetical protein
MPSFMQAVERLRERGQAPDSGRVCVRPLGQQQQSGGCLRPLIARALEPIAEKRPWAIILCRYKGETADPVLEPPAENFFRQAFAPGAGGLVEYWRDVTFGKIDISGSKIFDWVELEIPLSDGDTGSGTTRGTTVDYAIAAARRRGDDPETGFHSQIAVITRNWSQTGVPAGSPTWQAGDPLAPWYQYWIDGSADSRGKVTLTPPFDGNVTAHEMGHSFGMQHDVGADLTTHYQDPCCIMSQNNSFTAPGFGVAFGPAVCLPHLVQRGWMFSRRLYADDGSWMSQPNGVTLPLAPLTDAGARANLGLKLPFSRNGMSWDYYVEYVTPIRWDQGLQPQSFVFVRRIVNVANIGNTPAILGSIVVPTTAAASAQFVEPSGNVRFDVQWFDAAGRVLKITARKL